jgi:ADP-glucose pyrophosphorylase
VTRCVLWDDVVIAGEAELHECVVADGVRIPAGVHLSRRVIVPRGHRRPGAGDVLAGELLVSPLDAQRRRAS